MDKYRGIKYDVVTGTLFLTEGATRAILKREGYNLWQCARKDIDNWLDAAALTTTPPMTGGGSDY